MFETAGLVVVVVRGGINALNLGDEVDVRKCGGKAVFYALDG